MLSMQYKQTTLLFSVGDYNLENELKLEITLQ